MAYRFALQRPTVLMVVMAIVCLFGLASLMRVPIQLIPDLDPRWLEATLDQGDLTGEVGRGELRWPAGSRVGKQTQADGCHAESEVVLTGDQILSGLAGGIGRDGVERLRLGDGLPADRDGVPAAF